MVFDLSFGLILFVFFSNPNIILAFNGTSDPIDPQLCKCENLKNKPKARIFDGELVSADDLKFMGFLYWRKLKDETANKPKYNYSDYIYGLNCSVMVLNDQNFLTAAHCVIAYVHIELDKKKEFRIAAGGNHDVGAMIMTDNLNSHIVWSNYHPDFRWQSKIKSHDIGLFRTGRKFELGFRTNIFPVCVTFERIYFEEDTKVIVSGFGQRIEVRKGTEPTIQKLNHSGIEIYHFPNSLMLTMMRTKIYTTFYDDEMISTKDDDRSFCKGDGGGPLLYFHKNKLQLFGIVSSKYGKPDFACTSYVENDYTPLWKQKDYLDDYIGKTMCLPPDPTSSSSNPTSDEPILCSSSLDIRSKSSSIMTVIISLLIVALIIWAILIYHQKKGR